MSDPDATKARAAEEAEKIVRSAAAFEPGVFERIKTIFDTDEVSDFRVRQLLSGVPSYRTKRRELDAIWAELSARDRLRVTDIWTPTAQVLCLACFVAWGLSFPVGPLRNFAFIAEAFAQAAPVAKHFDPKPYIHLTIFLMLFAAFALSVWVSYFSDSEKSADHAGTVAKTLLGFFIGAATNYLGMATPG